MQFGYCSKKKIKQKNMKVIAVNGSPNENGNTFHALEIVGSALKSNNIEFEIIHIGHKPIHGCTACRKCASNKDGRCSINNDELNKHIASIFAADGLLLGSPVYYSGVAGAMKCFLDRLFYTASSNGGLLRHKVGASVVAVRRTGGSSTFDCLNHYFTISEMFVASSNYWNIIHGRNPGEALQDTEGVQTMRVLGNNMAWLLKMIEATKSTISPPTKEVKEVMNFIR